MSKCWICGKEMTKTIGGCEHCKDCGVGYNDLVFRPENTTETLTIGKDYSPDINVPLSDNEIIIELQKQVEEKNKTIQGLIEAQKYLEESASYQMFLDIQKQLEEKKEKQRRTNKVVEQFRQRVEYYRKENAGLENLLKTLPVELIGAIKGFCNVKYFNPETLEEKVVSLDQINDFLDDLLQEYQK